MREIKRTYEQCPEFRDYVDKYAKKHGISPDDALDHALIRNIWVVYQNREDQA